MSFMWKVFTPVLSKTIKRLEDNDATLTEVQCDGTSVTRESLKQVCNAIKKGPIHWIVSFKLARCNISESALREVMHLFEPSQTLTTFDLEWCNLKNRGAAMVCSSLAKISTLTRLSFAGNDLTTVDPITKLLSQSSLRMLNLSNNKLGKHGDGEVILLAESLCDNMLLTSLDLASNDIGMDFVDSMSDVLFRNFSLTQIKLNGNIKISRIKGSLDSINISLQKNKADTATVHRGIEARDVTETSNHSTPNDLHLEEERQKEQEKFDILPLQRDPVVRKQDLEQTIKGLREQLAKSNTEVEQLTEELDKEIKAHALSELGHEESIQTFTEKIVEMEQRHENQLAVVKADAEVPVKAAPSALALQLAEEHYRMNMLDGSFRESLKGSFESNHGSDIGQDRFHQELDALMAKLKSDGTGDNMNGLREVLRLIDKSSSTFFESQVATMSSEINTIMAHRADVIDDVDTSEKDLTIKHLEQKLAAAEEQKLAAEELCTTEGKEPNSSGQHEAALKKLKDESTAMQTDLMQNIGNLKAKLTLKEKTNATLLANESKHLETIASLREEVNEVSTEKDKLNGVAAKLNAILADEGMKLSESRDQLAAKKEELCTRDAEMSELQNEIVRQTEEIAKLTATNKTLDKEKTRVEVELHRFIKESDAKREKLERKLKEKETSLSSTANKLNEMQELNDQFSSQIKKLQKEEGNYLNKLDEMRQVRNEYDTDMKDLQKNLEEQQKSFELQAAEKDKCIKELEGKLQTKEAISRAEAQQDIDSSSESEDEKEQPQGMPTENWVQSADVKTCIKCSNRFTFKNRRHHCRRCGNVFCGKCCRKSPLTDNKRVCIDCNTTGRPTR